MPRIGTVCRVGFGHRDRGPVIGVAACLVGFCRECRFRLIRVLVNRNVKRSLLTGYVCVPGPAGGAATQVVVSVIYFGPPF